MMIAKKFKNYVLAVAAYVLFAALILWLVIRLFFQKELGYFFDNAEKQFPLLFPLSAAIVCGFFAVWQTKDIVKGVESGLYSTYQLLLFWASFIVFTIWFGSNLLDAI